MVIDAIRAGRDVACEIDRTFREERGEPAWTPPPEEAIAIPFEVEEDVVECPQTPIPMLEATQARRDFSEVELGYTRQMARAEARRCLRCDGAAD